MREERVKSRNHILVRYLCILEQARCDKRPVSCGTLVCAPRTLMEARLRNKEPRVPVATPLPSQLFWNVPCRRGNTQTSLSRCLQGLPPYKVLFRTRPLTLMGLALIFSLCRFSPVFPSVSLLGTCHCAPVAFSTPGPEGSTWP